MNYCPNCAAPAVRAIPEGDNRLRDVCTECGTVHYQNPRIITGVICTWEQRILLCRRAIEPRHGYWTLPAGFMENGEDCAAGALRETREEAGAEVELAGLYAVFDVVHAEQVHLFFRGTMTSAHLDPGVESLEAALFAPDEIPWDALAFQTVWQTLRWFLEDSARGAFPLHHGIVPPPSAVQGT